MGFLQQNNAQEVLICIYKNWVMARSDSLMIERVQTSFYFLLDLQVF